MMELNTSNSSKINETTQLLETTKVSYNTQAQEESQTNHVININSEHEPTIPFDQLKHHIQDVLVFGKTAASSYQQLSRSNSSSTTSNNNNNNNNNNNTRSVEKQQTRSMDQNENSNQKFKKRDVLSGALKFATDQWLESQGLSDQVDAIHQNPHVDNKKIQQESSSSSSGSSTLLKSHSTNDNSVSDVWDVAKNASVCAVLGLLSERRQGKISITDDTDATLQRLALSTLEHGMKQTNAKDMLRQEMLFRPLLGDKSAVQWAAENNCEIFLNDESVKSVIKKSWIYGDIEWRTNPNHPFHIWNCDSNDTNRLSNQNGWSFAFVKQSILSYLARWASPRYQCLIGLFTALIYMGFHLATLSNVGYMNTYIKPYEYFYYALVISDLLLETSKFLSHPTQSLRQPSTYITFVTAILLSFGLMYRLSAFAVDELIECLHYLYVSFEFLAFATPFMIFRLFIWIDDLWWPVYKINYIVHCCVIQSLWVFLIAFISFLGFTLGFSALQRDDITPWAMIRSLIFSASYKPNIDETVNFEPQVASGLLVFFLFVMFIIIGILLVASFISTILSIVSPRSTLEKMHQQMEAKRATRAPRFGVFIPNVAIELIVGVIVWLVKKIQPNSKLTWVERFRQILWFIVFSPIIIFVAIFDLIYYLIYNQKEQY